MREYKHFKDRKIPLKITKKAFKMNDSEYIENLNSISSQISFYFVVILPTTSLCLNTFALLVLFLKPSLQKTKNQMVYLLKCQYIIDTIVVINIIFNYQSSALFSYSLFTISDFTCRFFYVWNRFLIHVSSWIQVIISTDRFLSVYLARKQTRQTKYTTLYTILTVAIALLIIDATNAFHYLDQNQCTGSVLVQISIDILSVLLRTIIPIVIMAAIDVVLVNHIKAIRRRLFIIRSGHNRSEHHFTISVVLVNFVFFFFNFPLSVSLILQNVFANTNSLSPIQLAQFNLYSSLASIFAFFFQTLEFYINFSTNRLFRREILDTLGLVKKRRRVVGITNSYRNNIERK